MAPPEKIYFALDLLTKGDKYYANLLLDIPTAGILDLGDMEKSAAEEWISAFRTFVNDNTTSFKIPVLYEHNNEVKFLPFGKVPNDIMFNQITSKYAALVAAAYGMSLSDIGLQTTTASGETLAGSIRQERKTRNTGFARAKAKMKAFFDGILPDTLQFNWIDYDDELNVAMGRARLASSQAFKTFQDEGNLSRQEIRSQLIADGLITIAIPEALPPDAKPLPPPTPFGGGKVGGNTEPELIKQPKAPSAGGEGDVGKSIVVKSKPKTFASVVESIVTQVTPKILDTVSNISEDEVGIWRSIIGDSVFGEDGLEIQKALEPLVGSKLLVNLEFTGIEDELRDSLGTDYADVPMAPYIDELKSNVKKSINGFVGRCVAYTLNDVLFDNNVFADSSNVPYNLIVKQVQSRMEKSLTDFVAVLLRDESLKILNKIQKEN